MTEFIYNAVIVVVCTGLFGAVALVLASIGGRR